MPSSTTARARSCAELMAALQINSNYFDGRFPRLDNCPFERQLAEAGTTDGVIAARARARADLTDRRCVAFGFHRLDDRVKPCNLRRRPAPPKYSRRFLGLIYVWATTRHPFISWPASAGDSRDSRFKERRARKLKRGHSPSPLNGAIMSLRRILSFDGV